MSRHDPAPAAEEQASEYSGRILLRLPKSLHAELVRQAELEGVSLNLLPDPDHHRAEWAGGSASLSPVTGSPPER
jgi:hypothetical protein